MPNINPNAEAVENHNVTGRGEMVKAMVPGAVEWPLPRYAWRDEVQQSYEAYREDVSASVARAVDIAIIMRYFDLQEMTARVFDEILELDVLTNTSDHGAVASHPHLAMFCRLITTSVKLANEIGATPQARVRLGIHVAEGRAAQQALEAAINTDPSRKVDHTEIVVELSPDDDSVVMSW